METVAARGEILQKLLPLYDGSNAQSNFQQVSFYKTKFLYQNTVKTPNKGLLKLLRSGSNFCKCPIFTILSFYGQIKDFVSYFGVPYLEFSLYATHVTVVTPSKGQLDGLQSNKGLLENL